MCINLPGVLQVRFKIICKIIRIYKFVSCIIRWVDKNHLNFVGIALLEKLQHLKIITLDKQVLGRIPIHAFFRTRQQCPCRGCQSNLSGLLLTMPVQPILLFALIQYSSITQQLAKGFEIHPPFSEGIGEKLFQLFDVL